MCFHTGTLQNPAEPDLLHQLLLLLHSRFRTSELINFWPPENTPELTPVCFRELMKIQTLILVLLRPVRAHRVSHRGTGSPGGSGPTLCPGRRPTGRLRSGEPPPLRAGRTGAGPSEPRGWRALNTTQSSRTRPGTTVVGLLPWQRGGRGGASGFE